MPTKRGDFETDLKQLANQFNLQADSGLFEQVMAKRGHSQQRQKRRRALIWLAALFLPAAGISMYLIFTGSESRTKAKMAQTKEIRVLSEESSANTGQSSEKQPVDQTVPVITPQIIPYDQATPDHRKNAVPKNNAVKHSKNVTGRNPQKPDALNQTMPGAERKTDAAPHQDKIHGSQSQTNVKPVVATDALQAGKEIAENKQTGDQSKTSDDPNNIPLSDSVVVAAAVSAPVTNDSAKSANTKQGGLVSWSIFAGAGYDPLAFAKNTARNVMLNQADSVGLSEDANYAFHFKSGVICRFGERWSAGIGIGYHKIKFDEVRITEVRADSAFLENTASPTLKSTAYHRNLVDISMSWIEVPLFVQYVAPVSSRVGVYGRTGLAYQRLFNAESYEFISTNAGTIVYSKVENQNNTRFRKDQVLATVETGIDVKLGKHFNYQAGLSYRRHFYSYYREDYAERKSASFIGFSSTLLFNF